MQLALGWDEDSQLQAASDSSVGAAGSLRGSSDGGSSSGGGNSADRIGWAGPFWLHALAQVAATALGLPIAVGLVVLLVWNAYLFLRNTTTIEHHEGRLQWPGFLWCECCASGAVGWLSSVWHAMPCKLMWRQLVGLNVLPRTLLPAHRFPTAHLPLLAGVVAQYMAGGGKPRGHLFDLGVHDNLHAVCGDDLLCWLLPGRAAAHGDGVSFPTRL